jgi:hypothetical protein
MKTLPDVSLVMLNRQDYIQIHDYESIQIHDYESIVNLSSQSLNEKC